MDCHRCRPEGAHQVFVGSEVNGREQFTLVGNENLPWKR